MWSSRLAYAIGLLATDGCLSPDGRHLDLTSKDVEQLENFKFCLDLSNKISPKKSGSGRISYHVQFGNVKFYRFLQKLGLSPRKSKILGPVKIPRKYFFDFLRGHFDGDGSFYAYLDPRWKNSLMFYMCFVSASKDHIGWLQREIKARLNINGFITKAKRSSVYQLRYAKRESLKLIRRLYYNQQVICLSRKHRKIEAVLQRQLSAGAVMVARLA